jgi:hypothetical protein
MKKKRKNTKNKKLLWLVSLLLVIAVLVAYFVHLNTKPITKVHPPVTANSNTKGQNYTKPSVPSTQSATNSSPSIINQTLLAPTGDFVSNHNPGENGAPSTETSVCNTTPGSECQIIFTMNGITKSLPRQTADQGGAVYWQSWDPNSIGLTPGSWSIEAIATLGSQIETTNDAMDLVIM